MLEQAIRRYQNRTIETAEGHRGPPCADQEDVRDERLALNEDELAFYDGLCHGHALSPRCQVGQDARLSEKSATIGR